MSLHKSYWNLAADLISSWQEERMVLTQTMEGGEKPMVLIFYSFLPEGNFGLLQVFTCWSQMTFDSTCLNCWKLFITSHDNQILYCRTLQTVIGSLWRGSLHIWDKCVTPSLSEGIKCIAGKVTIQQFQV